MIFFFCRPAQGVVEVPDHLDGGVVGLGAGVGEEHLAHGHRRAGDQHLREVDHRLVRFGGERVVERQLAHLGGGGLHQAFVVEAKRGAPQAGDALDIFLAGLVPNAHALAAGDHHRADLLVRLQIGVGVQHVGDVAGGGGVRAERRGRCHEGLLFRLGGQAQEPRPIKHGAKPRSCQDGPDTAHRSAVCRRSEADRAGIGRRIYHHAVMLGRAPRTRASLSTMHRQAKGLTSVAPCQDVFLTAAQGRRGCDA